MDFDTDLYASGWDHIPQTPSFVDKITGNIPPTWKAPDIEALDQIKKKAVLYSGAFGN
jgi:hypothetical protein